MRASPDPQNTPRQRRFDQQVSAALAAIAGYAPFAVADRTDTASNTGAVESDLYSVALPAGLLAATGDKLTATFAGTFLAHATATREVRLYFGGTAIFTTGPLTASATAGWVLTATIVRVSATVVRYAVSLVAEGVTPAASTAVGELTGLTLSAAQVFKVTGEAAGVGAATGDITAVLGTVSAVPHA